MNPSTYSRRGTSPGSILKFVLRMASREGILIFFAVLAIASRVQAQSSGETGTDGQTVQMLLKRIDQLEARVAQLEGSRPTNAPSPAPATKRLTLAASPDETGPQAETVNEEQAGTTSEMERLDVSKTLLRIRGFGDISFHGDTQKGDTTSFSLGELNLFVTSDVSDKFKFLSEIVFEAGQESIYGVNRGTPNSIHVDVERLLLQYSRNDHFNLSAGRGDTAIGYYNTAYPHSTWFQTTTERPFLFRFEDRGGILPIYTVGVSASGLIPSGRVGLHYVAQVGNGRASRSPLTEAPVQNVIDGSNHKAFNLALFARPEAVRGLQTGFSVYRDLLSPNGEPGIGETILAAHAVYIRPKFEWLNEAMVIRHAPQGLSQVFHTPGFYTQISKAFGAYRPYFRYQYVNASSHEPIFPDVGRRQGPSAGIRFDASEFVALKLQYDYTSIRNQQAISALALQLAFTF